MARKQTKKLRIIAQSPLYLYDQIVNERSGRTVLRRIRKIHERMHDKYPTRAGALSVVVNHVNF